MKAFTLSNSKYVIYAAVAAVAAVSFASIAPVAQAAEVVSDQPALVVHYSDLNLNAQMGVATLYNRIRNAAHQVCGNTDSRRLEEVAATKTCVDHAIASSVSAVGNAQLTAEYGVRTGVVPKQVIVASLR